SGRSAATRRGVLGRGRAGPRGSQHGGSLMSSAGAVVERYAQAIFELGLETGELGAISEGLRAVAEVYSNSRDLRVALESPVLDEARRQEILREGAERVGVRGTALNALRVLAQRRRLA